MKFIKRSLYVIIIQGGLMKKLYKSLVFIFSMAILFSGCEKDKPKVNKDEDSVVMKTDEQIYDENLTDDFFDLLDDANKDLSDEDKTFLAKILRSEERRVGKECRNGKGANRQKEKGMNCRAGLITTNIGRGAGIGERV